MAASVNTSRARRRPAGIPFRAESQFLFRLRRTRISDIGGGSRGQTMTPRSLARMNSSICRTSGMEATSCSARLTAWDRFSSPWKSTR